MRIVNEYLYPVQKRNGPDSFWQLCKFVEIEDGTFQECDEKYGNYERINNEKRDKMVKYGWENFNNSEKI